MLLAYDVNGNVVATLDYAAFRDNQDRVRGMIDAAAHEENGGEHTDIWIAHQAVGSKVWPEFLGGRAHEFTVELAGPPGRKVISALVHKVSGYRRERSAITETGTSQHPLTLADDGRTAAPVEIVGSPEHLPMVGQRR